MIGSSNADSYSGTAESMLDRRLANDGRRESVEENDEARELAMDDPGDKSGVAEPLSSEYWGEAKVAGVAGCEPGPCIW